MPPFRPLCSDYLSFGGCHLLVTASHTATVIRFTLFLNRAIHHCVATYQRDIIHPCIRGFSTHSAKRWTSTQPNDYGHTDPFNRLRASFDAIPIETFEVYYPHSTLWGCLPGRGKSLSMLRGSVLPPSHSTKIALLPRKSDRIIGVNAYVSGS